SAYRAVDSSVDVSTKRYRYTGMERDEETGLAYHSARYYVPWLGRWTAGDPLGIGDGVNRFSYAGARPTSSIDRGGCEEGSIAKPLVHFAKTLGRAVGDAAVATPEQPAETVSVSSESVENEDDGPDGSETNLSYMEDTNYDENGVQVRVKPQETQSSRPHRPSQLPARVH